VRTSAQSLARQALAELDAPEPNRAPAQLTGAARPQVGPDGLASGVPVRELSWDDPALQAFVRNDPSNAATKRPWLVGICQELDRVGYNALGVRCGACGRGLGFFAFAPLASGVIVVWSRRRLPPKARQGGWRDLAQIPGADHGWDIDSWATALATGSAGPQSVLARNIPGIETAASRQWFPCPHCQARHRALNITLLREVLGAIADGTGDVVLGQPKRTQRAAPRHVERPGNSGSSRAWSTRR